MKRLRFLLVAAFGLLISTSAFCQSARTNSTKQEVRKAPAVKTEQNQPTGKSTVNQRRNVKKEKGCATGAVKAVPQRKSKPKR